MGLNDALEWLGFAALVAFGYCVWPPLALAILGVILIVAANVRALKAKPDRKPLMDKAISALHAWRSGP